MLPDGRWSWWCDDDRRRAGRWVAPPFEGGRAAPLFPDLPEGWSMGMSIVGDRGRRRARGRRTRVPGRTSAEGDDAASWCPRTRPRRGRGAGRRATGGLSRRRHARVHLAHASTATSSITRSGSLDAIERDRSASVDDGRRRSTPGAGRPTRPAPRVHQRARRPFDAPPSGSVASDGDATSSVDLPGGRVPRGLVARRQRAARAARARGRGQLYRVGDRRRSSRSWRTCAATIDDAAVRPDGDGVAPRQRQRPPAERSSTPQGDGGPREPR